MTTTYDTIFKTMIDLGKAAGDAKRELRDNQPRRVKPDLPNVPVQIISADSYQYHSALTNLMNKSTYALHYYLLGLISEVGELVELFVTDQPKDKIKFELGDVLWYVVQIATHHKLTLGGVMLDNIAKLFGRKERGVLQGEGDNR